MDWMKAQSTNKPAVIDTTSSKTVNYKRRNIRSIEVSDGENVTIMYEYEELAIPKDQWPLYLYVEQTKADVDFLTMMTEDEDEEL